MEAAAGVRIRSSAHSGLTLDPQEASIINPTVCPVHKGGGWRPRTSEPQPKGSLSNPG